MSLLRTLRFLGLGHPSARPSNAKRLAGPRFRLESLEDRTVPTTRPSLMWFTPNPPHAGQPAVATVWALTDQGDVVPSYTGNAEIFIYPSGPILGSHQFTSGDQGKFDVSGVTIPTAGHVEIATRDTATGLVSMGDYFVAGGGGTGFNLDLVSVEVPANDDVAPGEKTKIFVNLSNSGTAACHGKTTAHVTVGAKTYDVPITVNIPKGGTQRVPVKLTMPKLDLSGVEELNPGDYDPQVTIDPISGETDSSDNSATAANPLQYEYRFGHIEDDAAQSGAVFGPSVKRLPPEKLVTVEGETFTMHGAGYAVLIESAGGWDLRFSKDTDSTSWAESSGGKKFTLTSVKADTPIAGLFMLDATAIGTLNFNGGLASTIGKGPGFTVGNLGQASAATTVNIAHIDGGQDAGIAVGEKDTPGSGTIQNTTINAVDGIGFLAADQGWVGGGSINTPYLTTILSGGDFSPNITVTTPAKNGDAIHEANIKGAVSGLWNAAPGAGTLGIGDVTVDSANTWYLAASGAVKRIKVLGDWFGGSLGSATIGTLDVHGSLTAQYILAFGAFANGEAIHAILVGDELACKDVSATSGGINKLVAKTWPTSPLDNKLKATWVGTIAVPGEFGVSLDLTDATVKSSLKSIKVGHVAGAAGDQLTWKFASNVGLINVDSLAYVSISAAGNIGSFTQPAKSISPVQFSNSLVTANAIGLILVRNVDAANTQTAGFKTSLVLAYFRYNGGQVATHSLGLTTAGSYDAFGQYSLQIT